jgi:hypothetical protein
VGWLPKRARPQCARIPFIPTDANKAVNQALGIGTGDLFDRKHYGI